MAAEVYVLGQVHGDVSVLARVSSHDPETWSIWSIGGFYQMALTEDDLDRLIERRYQEVKGRPFDGWTDEDEQATPEPNELIAQWLREYLAYEWNLSPVEAETWDMSPFLQ